MENLSQNNVDRISHNIQSLSRDMYEIKKTILVNEKEKNILSKKTKKRRESLKKAQAKFKNVSTNLKLKEYEEFEKRLKEVKMSKSAYLKKLILDDLSN